MRRPSPLPQPPAPQPGARAAVRPESERTAAPETAPDPEGIAIDEQVTAPILPWSPSVELDDPMSGHPSAVDPTPVGLRDVRAAARARRKALRAEVRRFTGRQRRRRLVWIGVAASLVVLTAVTVGAAYSPLFAVERVTVVGGAKLDAAAVEDALADQIGTPLPLVDDSEVKAALVGFPLIESYALEARPPHDLVVRIVERTPIGYIESAAGFTLVDAAGVALATTPTAGSDAPVLTVEGGADSAAFEAVGHVMRSLPEAIRAQVTAVSATTPDDVRLTLGGTNTAIVWGSADQSAEKATSLAAIMISHPPANVSEYDVSSPTAVVVR